MNMETNSRLRAWLGRIRGGRTFVDEDGGLRTVWKILVGLAACAIAYFGTTLALTALFGALFHAWGLNQNNLYLAPAWAQAVVAAHTGVVYFCAYALTALAGAWATRRWRVPMTPERNVVWRALSAGAAPALILTGCALASDSLRFAYGWPRLTAAVWLWALVLAAGSVAEEVLLRRVVGDPLNRKRHYITAAILSAALCVVIHGAVLQPLRGCTLILMSLCGYAWYRRGGLRASVAHRIAWSAVTTLLFGFPGASGGPAAAVWPLYTVSDDWLTGGAAGPEASAAALLMWLCLTLYMYRKPISVCIARLRSGNKPGKAEPEPVSARIPPKKGRRNGK